MAFTGHHSEAELLLRHTLSVWQRVGGEDHPESLTVASKPNFIIIILQHRAV